MVSRGSQDSNLEVLHKAESYGARFAGLWLGKLEGSNNTLITQWLLFFISNQMKPSQNPTEKKLLKALQQSLFSATVFWGILHSHGLWLPSTCAQRCQHHLSRMIRGYKSCAQKCHELEYAGFGVKPKLHALHHVSFELLSEVRAGGMVLNPLAFSCELNEDAVGRITKL